MQVTWLEALGLDWPTTLTSPRKSFCPMDMIAKLPAQRTLTEQEGISQKSHSSQFQEKESAQQHSMQLSPSIQHTNSKQGELCRHLFRGRYHPPHGMRNVVKIEIDK